MTDWLLGTLLATSGLVVLVLLIREPVRRHFGARVAYGLWLIPASRLLMPTLTETVERTVPASPSADPFVPAVSVEPMLLAATVPPEPGLIDQLGGWPTLLTILWIGVAIGLFASRMIAFRRERLAILASSVEIGRAGSIRILQSPQVRGPLAFGIFDRVIAVPVDFMLLYDDRERQLALDHELAHHRSGDLVVNLFAFVLLCLQWFNPLAWVAHAAFRFDQEAACDARVLDKVNGRNRADYGRTIAKAASGRALLFASALDQRKTLHRRLKSMLTIPTANRRLAGRLMVVTAVAFALPLTATRAINYIDLPASQPAQPRQPSNIAAVLPVAAVQPVAPVAPVQPLHVGRNGTVMIDGREKQWKDLTPEEKNEVRRSLSHAKEELARTRIDREEIQREVREAMAEAKIDKDELRRELADARVEIEQAMREVDVHADEIRRSGQDPEQIRAQVRVALKSVEAIDVEAITRTAVNAINAQQIEASVAAAEASVARAQAEIEQLEERLHDD